MVALCFVWWLWLVGFCHIAIAFTKLYITFSVSDRFNILHITFDETSDENDYALCYDLVDEDDLFIDELYIAPSYDYGEYEIDCTEQELLGF